MSRFHFSVILILLLVLAGINIIDKQYRDSLPKIVLPEAAHHVVGQIPLIEHYDDGDLGGKPGYKSGMNIQPGTFSTTEMVPVFQGAMCTGDFVFSEQPNNGAMYVSMQTCAASSSTITYQPRRRRIMWD